MSAPAPSTTPAVRRALVARGFRLAYTTLAYNAVEAGVAIAAGVAAGSVALVGFGADSLIELTAGAAALWRLRADHDPARRAGAERASLRVVGACFLALAVYVAADAALALARHEAPHESDVGIALAALSAVVMPLLARAKRRVARGMNSDALSAEATQTSLCAWLSAILLAGLALNATLGWWWADPVAALAMVPIMAREGVQGVRGREACGECCG
ncbi:MAG: cation transporter [Gemmatimonadaceae bacterium]